MRVEVEVYKGPLSKDQDIQMGELVGVLEETHASLTTIRSYFSLQYDEVDKCISLNKDIRDCTVGKQLIESSDYLITEIGNALKEISKSSKGNPNINTLTSNEKKALLVNSARIGNRLHDQGFYWAGANYTQPPGLGVRNDIVKYAELLSEYGNQITSRADALYQQELGNKRQLLPLSVYLRDSEATDFQNLLAWQEAGMPYPENSCGSGGPAICREHATDRIRGMERLFSDYNWSKVNTVYASGRGDVSMAFVKDDIGNWNLKTFDADPSELVQAYSDMTKAGVELAVDAVKKGITGGADEAILATASRLTRGKISESPGGTVNNAAIQRFRDLTMQRLTDLEAATREKQTSLQTRLVLLGTFIAEKQTEIDNPPAPEGDTTPKIAEKAKALSRDAMTTTLNIQDQGTREKIRDDAERAFVTADKAIDGSPDDAQKAQILARNVLSRAELQVAREEHEQLMRERDALPQTTLNKTSSILQEYTDFINGMVQANMPE